MVADQQADYDAVRAELLREYHITTMTFSRRMFDTPFDSTNPDIWLSKYRQHFQWRLSSSPLDSETTMLMEVTLWRLPKWLKQMRNLNPRSFKELSEAIVRHLANQPRREQRVPRPAEMTNKRGRLRPDTTLRPILSRKGLNQIGTRYPMRGGLGGEFNICQPPKDLREIRCFQCNKAGYIKRDCRVKLEQAQLVCETRENASMNQWTRKAKLNGRAVKVWLNTGSPKSLVHTQCVAKGEKLGWDIPYATASSRRFPAARVTLE